MKFTQLAGLILPFVPFQLLFLANAAGVDAKAAATAPEWTAERLVAVTDRVLKPRQDSPYVDSLVLADLRTAGPGQVRLLLGVMLSRAALDAPLNAALIQCMSTAAGYNGNSDGNNGNGNGVASVGSSSSSGSSSGRRSGGGSSNRDGPPPSDWGAYSADRFTLDVIQIEYFALVADDIVARVANDIDAAVRDGSLAACVRARDPTLLPAAAELFSARAIVAPAAHTGVDTGGTPAWVIAVVLGILALGTLASVVTLALKGEPVYTAADYSAWEREVVEQLQRLESTRPRAHPDQVAVARIDRQLRNVAGQRTDGPLSVQN